MHFGRRFHEDVVYIDPKLRSGKGRFRFHLPCGVFEYVYNDIYNVYSSKYSGKPAYIQTHHITYKICHVSSFSRQRNIMYHIVLINNISF